MSQDRILFELAGARDDVRFSPFCWRIRMALAHKGLDVQTVPWRFTDKDAIAASGQGKVPVLVDNGQWLSESGAIAQYLERAYPDGPSLFGADSGQALTRFVQQWTDDVLHPAIARIVLLDIFRILHTSDQDYFRRTREAAFGQTLEDVSAPRDALLAALRQTLRPLRNTLRAQPFLAGDAPAYADYIVFGAFQWARVVSPIALLEDDAPIAAWRDRLLDAFDGLARQAALAHAGG